MMKVYCVIGSRDGQGSYEPYGIYADKKRADEICACKNAHSKFRANYEVYEYEIIEE